MSTTGPPSEPGPESDIDAIPSAQTDGPALNGESAPTTSQAGTELPDAGWPSAEQRLPEQPGTERPDTRQPDTQQPDTRQSNTQQSDPATAPSGGAGGSHLPEALVEMRQVAGLTAGAVASLASGSFQFRESNADIGFSLSVDSDGTVTVIPGSANAMVEEILIEEPTPLGEAVLNVGSACFTVASPRPAPSSEYRLAVLEAARQVTPAIPVPDGLNADPIATPQTSSRRFGALFSRDESKEEEPIGEQAWQFLETIRDVRDQVSKRHRYLHPDPEELRSRLSRLDPGLWDRTPEHPSFGRFAVAYANIPWEPRFDDPDRIPRALHSPIRQMSCLAWVPVTANLLGGPLGIVGSRPAVLAAARSAIVSLAALSAANSIEFSIVTAEDMVDSWRWTSSLPTALFPTGKTSYLVAVADGMTHFDGAGLDHDAVRRGEMGLIALGGSLDDLPDYCATVLQIDSSGRCLVTNHLGERVQGTPIGMTSGFATTMAELITDAMGDDVDVPQTELPTEATETTTASETATVREAVISRDIAPPVEGAEVLDTVDPSEPPSTDDETMPPVPPPAPTHRSQS